MKSQPRETVLLPFFREKSRHISVVARLSGKPAKLIVDTGAGVTCIHSDSLNRYKLKLSQKTKKGGGVGSACMKLTNVESHDLSFEGVDLSTFKLIALDLSHVIAGLAKAKVEGVVGDLGADVLHQRRAVIDYARGVILLSK